MAVPRKRIVRIAALQLAKLCAPDVPPQLPADYAVEVGRGSKKVTVGADRGPATWPKTLAYYVLPGSRDVPTRCISNGLASDETTTRIYGPNGWVEGTRQSQIVLSPLSE